MKCRVSLWHMQHNGRVLPVSESLQSFAKGAKGGYPSAYEQRSFESKDSFERSWPEKLCDEYMRMSRWIAGTLPSIARDRNSLGNPRKNENIEYSLAEAFKEKAVETFGI